MGEGNLPRRLRHRKQAADAKAVEKKSSGFWDNLFGKKKAEEKKSEAVEPEPDRLRKKLKEESDYLASAEVGKFKEKHNRIPTRKELDEISETIYSQLKKETRKEREREEKPSRRREKHGKERTLLEKRRAERKRHRRREEVGRREKLEEDETEEENEEEALQLGRAEPEIGKGEEPLISEEEEKEISVKDLLKEEAGGKEEEREETTDEDYDKLSLEELTETEEFGKIGSELERSGTESITKEIETEKKCPHCGTKSSDIVFCSGCGAGFCSHCAKKVEVQEEHIKYVCPSCGSEFRVKRHK
ncbi:MAG: hypothetical protein QT03_C0001G0718 [archaeon GW2011_AR10]|uniref:Uncharacterized protein n=2 Tax=Candidatus Iainarchaeum sp. TaxID=3101447 RepID=A0A7J4IUN4_9ARCH|nr:MAG: hypothetical protein QT03_C0001G0718 [archaeon GW2011_AR10]HIH08059.1 hypothetical protein [Candidatus Diapherotrites archaeon]